MVDPQADSLLGTTLAHFKVDARLGAGGMGVVYRALDTRLNRLVALKVLPPQLAQDAERKALLLREARAAAAINHPNLAAIYEVDEQNGHAYIAMELVQGRSLRHLLAHGPLPLELALAIAVQIAQALHRAHSAGLVHRDLKPENVMVGDDGTVKLLDFGLAKRSGLAAPTGDTGARLTREGDVMGTPGYMSPEQAEGREIDHRSDLFALGAVLFEMLTGALPFKGKSTIELMVSSVRDPAPPLAPSFPPELVTLVAQLLEKTPDRRPPSAAQVIATLGAHAPVAPPPQSDPFAPTLASPGFASPVRARPSRALRLAIAAVAAVAVAGVAMHRLMPKKHPHLLAVADIDNRTGDRELDALSGMLITSLEQSKQFQVLTRARMVDLMRQLGKSDLERIDELAGRDVCARAGADALVISSVSRLGNSYQLDLKVAAPTEETYLFAAREMAAGKEEIPSKLDRLAQATRARLQTDDEPKSMEISVASSQSLEAYRSYFQAEAALDRLPDTFLSADAMKAQLTPLEHAVALDPGFVQAWNLIAFIKLTTGDHDGAVRSLSEAMKHLDRASPKDAMITRARHAEALRDYLTAGEKFADLIGRYPDEKLVLYEQGSIYFHHRRLEDSIAPLEHARKLDPQFGPLYELLALAYANLGRAPEAEQVARAYRGNVPGPAADSVLVNALLLSGKTDEAVATLQASQSAPAAPWTTLTLETFGGQYAKAEAAAAALEQTGIGWVQLDMQTLRAELALARGQPARAAELLAALENEPRLPADLRARLPARLALTWSIADDAEKTLAAAEQTNASDDKTARAMALVAIAELPPGRWAEGARRVDDRDKELVHALHELLLTTDPADTSAKLDRLRELDVYLAFSARHELEQQQLTSAIARSRECSDRPVTGDFASYDFVYLADRPRCLYWRGRAFEANGKTQEAAAEYRKILALWKDSEPLPLKAEVKRRLDVLQPPTPKVKNEPF